MIKLIKNLCLLGLLITSLTAVGAEQTQQKSGSSVETYSTPQIILYESNSDKKIIKTLSPTVPLVRIYQEGDWIKVGDTADGTVGWINRLQYQKTLEALNKADVQEIFISQTMDKNNKPQVKIVAYRNGKPLSKNEAQSLYEDIKKQQKLQTQYWQALNQNMLYLQRQMLTDFFQDPFFNQVMPLPVPVMVIENKDLHKN